MNTAAHAAPCAPAALTASLGEAPCLFDCLTRAFADDPAARWLWPEDFAYRRHFPRFARAFGGAALALGTAVRSPGHHGAALWLPPGAGPDEADLEALLGASLKGHKLAEADAIFAEMGRLHPTEPHWYLPLIGVEPQFRNRGHGAALLAAGLARADAEGLPAYLESTSPRNRPLYRRHGFEAVGEIAIGSCPPIVAMWRPARR